MKFIPLHPIPPEGRTAVKNDAVFVNMDHVFSIEKFLWNAVAGKPIEGACLSISIPDTDALYVRETRFDIMNLIRDTCECHRCCHGHVPNQLEIEIAQSRHP